MVEQVCGRWRDAVKEEEQAGEIMTSRVDGADVM